MPRGNDFENPLLKWRYSGFRVRTLGVEDRSNLIYEKILFSFLILLEILIIGITFNYGTSLVWYLISKR